MTNEERAIAWGEAFLRDMEKIGLKPFGRNSPPLTMPHYAQSYDPYAELMR